MRKLPSVVKTSIEAKPATPEVIEDLIQRMGDSLGFHFGDLDGYGYTLHMSGYTEVLVSNNRSEEEQAKTVVHELLHVLHDAWVPLPHISRDDTLIERMLDDETDRFFREYRDFTLKLYSRLKTRYSD